MLDAEMEIASCGSSESRHWSDRKQDMHGRRLGIGIDIDFGRGLLRVREVRVCGERERANDEMKAMFN